LVSICKLIFVIRKFRPHIIHTHTPKAGLLGMLAGWICQVPIRLHTVAGLPLMEASGFKKKILIVTERLTYACATRIYPNSKGLMHYIVSNISGSTAMRVIGQGSSNGIDSIYFTKNSTLEQQAAVIRNKYGIGDTDVVFGFVGRIVKDKGIGELIHAFRLLLNRSKENAVGGKRIFLLLVGPFEADLDPLSDNDKIFIENTPEVITPGFQSDVRPWIIASDIFVFPSYREGFPNVVMQASCLEVPCIVTDINGCNEIIQHNLSGLVVKPKNRDKLLEAMTELLLDNDKRILFAQRARSYVVENFDRAFIFNEILKEYNQLLNDHGSFHKR
jgi:glycosyltransferase involved in cell wall biosynthesis